MMVNLPPPNATCLALLRKSDAASSRVPPWAEHGICTLAWEEAMPILTRRKEAS